ncbi:MAG: glycosyltransferase family 4 protein [Myxococcales bacterium]|nr:glycosyltransferase family 4 protein [Myxococcales bacterium]
MVESFRVANISDSSHGFRWLDGRLPKSSKIKFRHFDRVPKNSIERRVYRSNPNARPDITGYRACAEAVLGAARNELDLLVTHLPTFAVRTAGMRRMLPREQRLSARTPHLAWAFNFTTLPTGPKRAFLQALCPLIDRFVVFSSMECELYADYLGIPQERLSFLPWCINPPKLNNVVVEPENFILSVGRTGRDYAVLMRAMRRIPHCRAVVVASPQSVEGLEIPPNVEVKVEIPFEEVEALGRSCRFMVIPLIESEVPFGHGVLVHSMFLKRALVVNRTKGFDDYVTDEESCLSFSWGNDIELAAQIDRLWSDQDLADHLAERAYQFAVANCTEQKTIEYFIDYVESVRQR